jgi:hypothetical protein
VSEEYNTLLAEVEKRQLDLEARINRYGELLDLLSRMLEELSHMRFLEDLRRKERG